MADIHPFTVIDRTVIFGERVKVWQFATICLGSVIGDDCVVGSSVWIGKGVRIGNGTRINDKTFICSHAVVGKNVLMAPGVIFCDDKYPKANVGYDAKPPIVRDNVSLGAGAILLPGVTIGEGALVGAGAVVTKNVPPGAVVYGNPARQSQDG